MHGFLSSPYWPHSNLHLELSTTFLDIQTGSVRFFFMSSTLDTIFHFRFFEFCMDPVSLRQPPTTSSIEEPELLSSHMAYTTPYPPMADSYRFQPTRFMEDINPEGLQWVTLEQIQEHNQRLYDIARWATEVAMSTDEAFASDTAQPPIPSFQSFVQQCAPVPTQVQPHFHWEVCSSKLSMSTVNAGGQTTQVWDPHYSAESSPNKRSRLLHPAVKDAGETHAKYSLNELFPESMSFIMAAPVAQDTMVTYADLVYKAETRGRWSELHELMAAPEGSVASEVTLSYDTDGNLILDETGEPWQPMGIKTDEVEDEPSYPFAGFVVRPGEYNPFGAVIDHPDEPFNPFDPVADHQDPIYNPFGVVGDGRYAGQHNYTITYEELCELALSDSPSLFDEEDELQDVNGEEKFFTDMTYPVWDATNDMPWNFPRQARNDACPIPAQYDSGTDFYPGFQVPQNPLPPMHWLHETAQDLLKDHREFPAPDPADLRQAMIKLKAVHEELLRVTFANSKKRVDLSERRGKSVAPIAIYEYKRPNITLMQ
jgi:hypothetical protein